MGTGGPAADIMAPVPDTPGNLLPPCESMSLCLAAVLWAKGGPTGY